MSYAIIVQIYQKKIFFFTIGKKIYACNIYFVVIVAPIQRSAKSNLRTEQFCCQNGAVVVHRAKKAVADSTILLL